MEFAHVPREEATVGALRAKAAHVDIRPKRGGGGKPPSDYADGFVTIGDMMKQMATAFATPFAGSDDPSLPDAEAAVRERYARE